MPRPTTPDGFAEFVSARSAVLLRAAWLLTGDHGKAEDLLQTVLTSAWARWTQITEGEYPEAYVRKMLFTTYVSWWRRKWRFEVPARTVPETVDEQDVELDVITRDALDRALAALSRQQRAVVVLRYFEDLSVPQTAELLGCSTSVVKVQTARALTKLRAHPQLRLPMVEEVGR